MKSQSYKVKIGIVGCGAIGSGIATRLIKNLPNDSRITGLYDTDYTKALKLQKKIKLEKVATQSLDKLIRDCDCMVEAINSDATVTLIKKAIQAKRTVLAMSVGKLLNARHIFQLAKKNKCYILLPSGAIAGIDAIKAASQVNIKNITLTTRKPLKGFKDNLYLAKRGIALNKIKKETKIFDGNVAQAVKSFPQNINVAATIALASQLPQKLRVRIFTSPHYRKNIHEIKMTGDFGTMTTKTENVVCPDNPKSSYLAVLSGFQTLKQFCTGILVGT